MNPALSNDKLDLSLDKPGNTLEYKRKDQKLGTTSRNHNYQDRSLGRIHKGRGGGAVEEHYVLQTC